MTIETLPPPEAEEYAPAYGRYVAKVRTDGLLALLRHQAARLRTVCGGLDDSRALHRYEAGKWSVKEVLGHLSDTERVLAYRLLRISRGDETPLPGFDENAYVAAAEFDGFPVLDLVEDFEAVRGATLRLVERVQPDAWLRRGTANDAPVSARALAFIIAGHVEHHMELLHDRYGLPSPAEPSPSLDF